MIGKDLYTCFLFYYVDLCDHFVLTPSYFSYHGSIFFKKTDLQYLQWCPPPPGLFWPVSVVFSFTMGAWFVLYILVKSNIEILMGLPLKLQITFFVVCLSTIHLFLPIYLYIYNRFLWYMNSFYSLFQWFSNCRLQSAWGRISDTLYMR